MSGLAGQESGTSDETNVDSTNGDTGAHGVWQILPGNWGPWAKEAGLSPSAPQTLDNQRIVVKAKMISYFVAYGSWDAVARAWYSGRPFWHSDVRQGPSGKYPSVNGYASSVLKKVGTLPCG